MTELNLTRDERLALKAHAHHLDPVVLLGAAGATDAVVKEIDRALAAHELIKIRVPGDDRDAREAIFADLAERLDAARVQMIGKLLVLYRPRPEQPETPEPPKKAKAPAKKRAAPSAKSAAPREPTKRVAPKSLIRAARNAAAGARRAPDGVAKRGTFKRAAKRS
jgi:putative YhbY family RNA-binding protein